MHESVVPLLRLMPTERPIPHKFIAAAGAGFPSPAQDWEDDAINLHTLLRLDRPASFVFRVSGQSMVEVGIFNDDILVVDRDIDPVNGDIVIAIVDGGFVVRQLVFRQGKPQLEARNSAMAYSPTVADENVEIWGVVRTAVRNFQRA